MTPLQGTGQRGQSYVNHGSDMTFMTQSGNVLIPLWEADINILLHPSEMTQCTEDTKATNQPWLNQNQANPKKN